MGPCCQFAAVAVALLLLSAPASGQFGGMPASRPEPKAVKADVPYISCQVCELVAKNAYRQVKAKRDALKPGKKVADAVSSSCSAALQSAPGIVVPADRSSQKPR